MSICRTERHCAGDRSPKHRTVHNPRVASTKPEVDDVEARTTPGPSAVAFAKPKRQCVPIGGSGLGGEEVPLAAVVDGALRVG